MSFTSSQKLRSHAKTHGRAFVEFVVKLISDEYSVAVNRYACVHPECIQSTSSPDEAAPSLRYFPTWTELQRHVRTVHPPVCPHTECKGRTFANTSNLKAHLRVHEQREREAELSRSLGLGGSNEEDEPQVLHGDERASKRRRGGEIGRDWRCTEEDCERVFKSVCTFPSFPLPYSYPFFHIISTLLDRMLPSLNMSVSHILGFGRSLVRNQGVRGLLVISMSCGTILRRCTR